MPFYALPPCWEFKDERPGKSHLRMQQGMYRGEVGRGPGLTRAGSYQVPGLEPHTSQWASTAWHLGPRERTGKLSKEVQTLASVKLFKKKKKFRFQVDPERRGAGAEGWAGEGLAFPESQTATDYLPESQVSTLSLSWQTFPSIFFGTVFYKRESKIHRKCEVTNPEKYYLVMPETLSLTPGPQRSKGPCAHAVMGSLTCVYWERGADAEDTRAVGDQDHRSSECR